MLPYAVPAAYNYAVTRMSSALTHEALLTRRFLLDAGVRNARPQGIGVYDRSTAFSARISASDVHDNVQDLVDESTKLEVANGSSNRENEAIGYTNDKLQSQRHHHQGATSSSSNVLCINTADTVVVVRHYTHVHSFR